ncbi:MAG TPA: hypothetical protein VG826_34015 [Pirellulales bacterium]|nr:hypothetical protein [Pirellulales bacterium]
MRLLLSVVCVASMAAGEARAQVAPLPGMASLRRTDMSLGENAANIGVRPARRASVSTVGRSYGNYFPQNNAASVSTITAAPAAASTFGQSLVNLNQPSMFQGGGAQRTLLRGSEVQRSNAAAQTRYGGSFTGQTLGGAVGLGNMTIQASQIAQTPAPMQPAQISQPAAPRQIAQPAQPSAVFNVPSTYNAFPGSVRSNGVYGSGIYGGGYPFNSGVQRRTY